MRDGGPGLTDEDLAVAFERSALYERYRGVRPVGTGLGLAIVDRLAPARRHRRGRARAPREAPASPCASPTGTAWNEAPRSAVDHPMTTWGFIGSGNIGSTVARLAIAAGHDVVISNSRGPETLADLVAELGPHARAATAAEAAEAGDVVVVTIPLKAYRDVPVDALAGKVVIDTMNYYPQRDGQIDELDDGSTTTSELLQAHLPQSTSSRPSTTSTSSTCATSPARPRRRRPQRPRDRR